MNSTHRHEDAWVEHIRALWGPSPAEVGPGDDACVLAPARMAISTDTLVEGVDFELDWAPPEALGHKALAANLSDLAAMGARPESLLLTLGWPSGLDDAFIERVLGGMHALSSKERLGLLGGDLTRAPGVMVSITILGRQENEPLLRSGGRPGDLLFISGPLGGPAAALDRFRSGERLVAFDPAAAPAEPVQRLLDRFFRPPSQIALGIFLAERRVASCCMDLSDGLAKDLGRLCAASACGAEIEEDALPLDPGLAGKDRQAAVETAIRGGEEQILLFAVRPGDEGGLGQAPVPLYRVGRLIPGKGIRILNAEGHREALAEPGFDHFLA